jgi:hypothetical protein
MFTMRIDEDIQLILTYSKLVLRELSPILVDLIPLNR